MVAVIIAVLYRNQNRSREAFESVTPTVEATQSLEPTNEPTATPTPTPTPVPKDVWDLRFDDARPSKADEVGDYSIVIPKKGGTYVSLSEEQIYRKLHLTMSGADYTEEDVIRVSCEQSYSGQPVVEEVIIPEEQINWPLVREPKEPNEDSLLALELSEDGEVTRIDFELNSVYETIVYEDEEYLYISLKRPYELYDKIIVIDAGHGGRDWGTRGGGVNESVVNLNVVKYLKSELESRPDIKVYYTRLDDDFPDLSARVEFANAIHADFLLSVHCNSNAAKSVKGVEVMYSSIQVVSEEFSSQTLAEQCLSYVSEETGMRKLKIIDRCTNLHLMKYCTMPCALIEFGFMTNESDLKIILSEKGQRACAHALFRVIEEFYGKEENE